MTARDFTMSFTLDGTPDEVFDAITDARGWWSGEIDGPTDRLGAEFTYRYRDLHRSVQRVTELVRGRRIAWRVLDATLSFVEDQAGWRGSTIAFDLTPEAGATRVRFSHLGLTPGCECYEACTAGWRSLLEGNLRRRVATGRAQGDAFA